MIFGHFWNCKKWNFVSKFFSWNWFIWFYEFCWPGLFKISWPTVCHREKTSDLSRVFQYRVEKYHFFYLTPTIIAVNKDAFLRKAYGLHQQILQMIETIFRTERLNFTAWHLPQFRPYLAEQIVELKHCLETKSNRFFLR